MIVLLAWLLFREVVAPTLLVAIPCAMAGVLLVTLDGAAAAPRQALGDAMILAGVVFAALYVLLSSRSVTTFHPLALAALQQSVGLLCALGMLVIALAAGAEALAAPTPHVLLLAMASGVAQYALAFWLYLIGLRALPVGSAGLFLALTPLFGVAGAAAVLGEAVSIAQTIGALMIVAAVLWATWRGTR
jgi:drug/metabolite transporter (DMT)-like permease